MNTRQLGLAAAAATTALALLLTGCTEETGEADSPDRVEEVALTDEERTYIEALEEIDSDIVHGKPDKALSRAKSQCDTIADNPGDEEKWADLAEQRFSSPTHPEGFGPEVATRIVELTNEHICTA